MNELKDFIEPIKSEQTVYFLYPNSKEYSEILLKLKDIAKKEIETWEHSIFSTDGIYFTKNPLLIENNRYALMEDKSIMCWTNQPDMLMTLEGVI